MVESLSYFHNKSSTNMTRFHVRFTRKVDEKKTILPRHCDTKHIHLNTEYKNFLSHVKPLRKIKISSFFSSCRLQTHFLRVVLYFYSSANFQPTARYLYWCLLKLRLLTLFRLEKNTWQNGRTTVFHYPHWHSCVTTLFLQIGVEDIIDLSDSRIFQCNVCGVRV